MAYTIPPQTSPSSSFAQRLTSATIRTGSILCVGIGPIRLMPELLRTIPAAGSNEAIKNLEAFAHSVWMLLQGGCRRYSRKCPFLNGMVKKAYVY